MTHGFRFVCAAIVAVLVTPALKAAPAPAGDVLRAGDLWLAPAGATGTAQLGSAIATLTSGKAAVALPVIAKSTADPVLGGYALLYQGRAQLALARSADAAATIRHLLATNPSGYLGEAAFQLAADTALDLGDWPTAVKYLQALSGRTPAAPERVMLALGRAARAANDSALAIQALSSVYYDYPLSDEAGEAAAELVKFGSRVSVVPTPATLARELARTQQLFAGGRYADARRAYVAAREVAVDADRVLVDRRIAQSDLALKHYASAYEEVRIILAKGASTPETEYLALSLLRVLGRDDEYLARARHFINGAGNDAFVESALNDLGTFYTQHDDNTRAATTFAELYDKFPAGPHADRAAWRAGWWAYKNAQYAEAIRLFESASVSMRHADYRPMWLFWAARSHEKSGEPEAARAGYRHAVADYRNSYYGRRAAQILDRLPGNAVVVAAALDTTPIDPPPPLFLAIDPPPAAPLIRALLAAGLYDDAVAELRYTQRTAGTSALVEATIAYALNRRGDLRPAITTMRRAYPQFLAEGGETMPPAMLAVIFPVQYWDLIRKYSALHNLDPYLMAALINQESTFDARSHSGADAWGLMQLLPSTGREYARMLGIAPFRTSRLTDPELNIRIGTAFFADMLKQFGNDLPATLAAYNAGEGRAYKWLADRPGMDRDEFIDDIPFPETQNYVKRILGQAEDYRFLYGTGKAEPIAARPRG